MANPVIIDSGLHVDGAVTTAIGARRAEGGLWARNSASNISVRNGVVWAGDSVLVNGTAAADPNMTVTVDPLHFVSSKASGDGIYRGCIPSTQTVSVAARPGSNSRIDVVWVMQQDTAAPTGADATTQGAVGITAGTPAGSPTKPAIPTGAVELATMTITSGTTSTNGVTINQTCQYTAARGTAIPVRNQIERDALNTYDGLQVWRLDLHTTECYTLDTAGWGAGWDNGESTYIPTWAAQSGTPAVGSGGSLTGFYQRRGSRVDVSVNMIIGTSGFDGGVGWWTFTAPMNASQLSYLSVRAQVPHATMAGNVQPQNFMGYAYIAAGTNLLIPYLPATPNAPGMSRVQNSSSPGNVSGTGVPQISTATGYSANAYTWSTTSAPIGGEFQIFGSYTVN